MIYTDTPRLKTIVAPIAAFSMAWILFAYVLFAFSASSRILARWLFGL